VSPPLHLNIFELAGRYGDRLALVVENKCFTFADLSALAVPVARHLTQICGSPDFSRIALPVHNREDTVIALLAMMAMRIPFVPLHPKLTDPERVLIEKLSGASICLNADDVALTSAQREHNVPITVPSAFTSRCATVMFTSGVSGTPKGAMLSHDALIASAAASAANLGWRPYDRWVLCLPLCHVGGLSVLTRCLLAGQCVILTASADPHEVRDAISRHGGTMLSVVPTVLERLLAIDNKNSLASLRAILVGGAASSAAMMEECDRRRIAALRTYGLTEACSQVASESPDRPAGLRRSCGRALPGIGVRVVNNAGADTAPGETGRILISGPALMDGYLNQPPLADRSEFDTGDTGWIDDRDELHVTGRADDTIITGGENVYPLEVEAVISQHPAVSDCVVFGVYDPQWGQAVAAALVIKNGSDFNDRALQEFCVQHLSSFRRPRRIALWEAFPLLGGGKIDRRRVARDSLNQLHTIQ